MYEITRYHDISAGHRVVGHENKCKHLHGHNYRIHFHCRSKKLDEVGRVIDFGVIKQRLCQWLEDNYDHRMLIWEKDDFVEDLINRVGGKYRNALTQSICFVPYNPTAENMARHLVDQVGPAQLEGTGMKLVKVKIEETAKCHASYSKEP